MYNHKSYQMIPDRTLRALDRWGKQAMMGGHFTKAILENDLSKAIAHADEENSKALTRIVMYCYNELPDACWGSPEKVKAWAEYGGTSRKGA